VDVPLRADEFGGPAFRPDGSLVGIGVAHHYRAASFLVPADAIAMRIADLATGIDLPAPPTYDPHSVTWPKPGSKDAATAGDDEKDDAAGETADDPEAPEAPAPTDEEEAAPGE
jgi:hypothetical protein